jgi:muconolactone delta-isomerase
VECDQTKEQSAREKRRDHDLQDYNIRLRLFERHGRVPNFDRLVAIAVS